MHHGPSLLSLVNKRDVDWDAFMPTIQAWNFARTKLCVTYLLLLDESMSGWKPKCSKRGGLPNITYEPRKPVDLGTMLRNAAECHTGILMHIDPVMSPERQGHKEYARTLNYLPRTAGSSTRMVSDAVLSFLWLIDVLRQVRLSQHRTYIYTYSNDFFATLFLRKSPLTPRKL